MRHALVPLGIVLLLALVLGSFFLARQRAVTAMATAKAAATKARQEAAKDRKRDPERLPGPVE
jgi:hypothetical protein